MNFLKYRDSLISYQVKKPVSLDRTSQFWLDSFYALEHLSCFSFDYFTLRLDDFALKLHSRLILLKVKLNFQEHFSIWKILLPFGGIAYATHRFLVLSV